jgi:peptidoglycan glycosyltransferase
MSLTYRISHITWIVIAALALASLKMAYWPLVRGNELDPIVLDPADAARHYRVPADSLPDGSGRIQTELLPGPVAAYSRAELGYYMRGDIYDRAGRPIARTEEDKEARFRVVDESTLAHTLGYVSHYSTTLGLGVTGVERSLNSTLLGLRRVDSRVARLLGLPVVGNDVKLTVDLDIQRAALQALGPRPGAVVVLDALSGAVLAMASYPTFDPSRMNDLDYVTFLESGCPGAQPCVAPLMNRATQSFYTPGSTWKIVTLAAALDSGQVTPDTVFDFGPMHYDDQGFYYCYHVGGPVGPCIKDRNHVESRLDLTGTFVTSANAAYAQLGDKMPAETLIDYAGRFGFGRNGEAPPIEVDARPAQVAGAPADLYTNDLLRCRTAFGQGEIGATPLHMALVVAGIVNDGTLPRPHLLKETRHPSGRLLSGEPGGAWIRRAVSPRTARQVKEMMIAVIEDGTGQAAAVEGLVVGGKTGTAQLDGNAWPHAWFVGFAQGSKRTVAIAVIVEHGGEGGQVAAPVFAQVARASQPYVNAAD